MSKYDVKARILKTGEERIYPEAVFNNICDDTENPLQFIEYVDLPLDNQPFRTPPPNHQPEVHQQKLIDALLKERADKQALENRIKELEASLEPKSEDTEVKTKRPYNKKQVEA